MGDASDNIPGVPASARRPRETDRAVRHAREPARARGELKGKMREKLDQFAEQARSQDARDHRSRRARRDVDLRRCSSVRRHREARRALRASSNSAPSPTDALTAADPRRTPRPRPTAAARNKAVLCGQRAVGEAAADAADRTAAVATDPGRPTRRRGKTHRRRCPHDYEHVHDTPEDAPRSAEKLRGVPEFCFDTETDGLDPRQAPSCWACLLLGSARARLVSCALPAGDRRTRNVRRGAVSRCARRSAHHEGRRTI